MMHISMFKGTQDDFVQVVCHQESGEEKLKSLGFVNSFDELEKPKPTKAECEEAHPSEKKEGGRGRKITPRKRSNQKADKT